MAKSVQTFRENGGYLPPAFRDFHDQKDLFKLIHQTTNTENHDGVKDVSWQTGHQYAIDIFLWVMARYGYTLQKSRADVAFHDLQDAIQKMRESERGALLSVLAPLEPSARGE